MMRDFVLMPELLELWEVRLLKHQAVLKEDVRQVVVKASLLYNRDGNRLLVADP